MIIIIIFGRLRRTFCFSLKNFLLIRTAFETYKRPLIFQFEIKLPLNILGRIQEVGARGAVKVGLELRAITLFKSETEE